MSVSITKGCRPQAQQEVVFSSFTHRFDLTYLDVMGVTIGTNTSVIWTIGDIKAGDILTKAHLHLTTPLQDLDDAAFNSDTLSFGDNGSATRYFSAVELNANGSYVVDSYLDPSSDHIYTATGNFLVTLNSMSGKDLTNIDAGQLYLEFTLLRSADPFKNPVILVE